MKQAIKNLHQGGCLGLLIDQRFNNGIIIPFFNHPSQTLDLPARLAVQNKIPIYMIKMMRLYIDIFFISIKLYTIFAALILCNSMNAQFTIDSITQSD